MRNLGLTGPGFDRPEDAVRWLGAVQSQDYGPAKWSVGMRTTSATDASLDRAYAEGTILRTHVLRPTWHFVLPEDIRWILRATAPRVHQLNAFIYRQQGLDEKVRRHATDVIAEALRGGKSLTRKEIGLVLDAAGIDVSGLRLGLLAMHAELEAIVCSGPPRGKQHTYALLDERAPGARRLSDEEALAELTLRYFTSHGPATAKDLAAWASLTLAQVTRGLDLVAGRLERIDLDGVSYWFTDQAPDDVPPSPLVHLLQAYDEYAMGYGPTRALHLPAERPVYNLTVLLDTRLAGHWKRTVTRSAVTIQVAQYTPLTRTQLKALGAQADRHGRFLGLPATVAEPTLIGS
jgi:hypothetical protein